MKILKLEDYRSNPAINYSTLAGLSSSPENLIKQKEETSSMNLGSVVDIMLTQPEKINDLVYLDEHVLPTDDTKLGKYIKGVFPAGLHDINIKLQVYNEINAGVKNPRHTCSELDGQAKDHFIHLLHVESLKKQGITVLNPDEHLKCSVLAANFMSNLFSSELFTKEKDVDKLYQVPIEFDYKGITMKCLIDILIIDHNKKTISAKDIKTTKNLYDFYKSVGIYRYDIQQAVYTMAARAYNKDILNSDYTVLPFEFVCGSFDYPGKILKYTINKPNITEILHLGWTGKSGRTYKSVDKLLEDMQWHYAKAQYDYHREVYENNGTINLEL